MEGSLVIGLALGFVALVVALLVYSSWQTICIYRIMWNWPRVPALALRAHTSSLGTDGVRVEVEVEYEFAGKRRRVWSGVPDRTGYRSGQPALDRIVEKYTGGKPITVIVNPENPDESYLRMPSLFILLMMILASFAFPAALLFPSPG